MKKYFKFGLSLLIIGLVHSANAAVHNFYESDATSTCNTASAGVECWASIGSPAIETHEFDISYDDTTSSLTLSVTTSNARQNQTANGFWLVVSDGPNPKSHLNEYAILYGSAQTGDLYAYQYDGTNSSNSWQNASGHLETFQDALTTTSFSDDYLWDTDNNSGTDYDRPFVQFDFSIDVTDINNAFSGDDWDGMQFDENIGIWFHPFQGDLNTDANGEKITGMNLAQVHCKDVKGYYDTGSLPTTTTDVPEPAPLTLMLAGLGLLAYSRRKRV